MKNWLRHIAEGSTFQGMEVFEIDGQILYAVLKIKKRKDELNKEFEQTYDSLEEAVAQINGTQMLFLTLNTSQVLGRNISQTDNGEAEPLVMEAFPNLDLENFYYQLMDFSASKRVHICKKDYINQFLDQLKAHGLSPVNVEIGISPVQNVLGHVQQEICGSNYKVSHEGSLELLHHPYEKKNMIGGLSLAPESLTSFSQILGYIEQKPLEGNLNDRNALLSNEFKNRRFFHFGLRVALGTFLGILLINFLAYSSYQQKLNSLGAHTAQGQQIDLLNTLQERVALKEEKLRMVGNAINSKSSFYLDRIANELPGSIQLDQMVYQPPLKPVREGKRIELEENVLLISGLAQDKAEFTQWTSSLEKKVWVDKVEITSYEYLSKRKDQFILNLFLYESE